MMSEEKKGAERLDPTSTDAMHWAECFCEQVEINSEDEVHIEPEFLMAYFANFWAAVNDPLQNTIESQAAEISALRERVKVLEGHREELYIAIHNGVASIFPPLDSDPDDRQIITSANNYRSLRETREKFRLLLSTRREEE